MEGGGAYVMSTPTFDQCFEAKDQDSHVYFFLKQTEQISLLNL